MAMTAPLPPAPSRTDPARRDPARRDPARADPGPGVPGPGAPGRRPRLERLAPWVDLFFKLSAGLAASLAIWRALQ